MADNGPGIDDAEKSKVVERFYRGDASRGTPGVGLGLSLVQAVAKLHGSPLELVDQAPGLRVVLTIPCPGSEYRGSRGRVAGIGLCHPCGHDSRVFALTE